MNRIALTTACIAGIVATPAFAQITLDWVTVGNAGNSDDPTTGFGAVAYEYRIGKYEITNTQYAAFLNAAAVSDPNNLYDTRMGSAPEGGIVRSGSSGSFTYSVKPNMGNKPVIFVSWLDAARMSNWLTNGQGSGSTESGTYTFNGISSISAITRDLSNPNQVFIPTENEWYKAAYHHPAGQGGDTDGYWLYATQSNAAPVIATATGVGDVANPGPSTVNHRNGADWNGLNGNVTTVGSAGNTSFYGASDMNGNVFEWNETLVDGPERGLRGGSWDDNLASLRASFRDEDVPMYQDDDVGFRLAAPALQSTPEPCSIADLTTDGTNPGDTLYGVPDGRITVADLTFFVEAWLEGCP
ncbi:MAG: SUMF1/EgtB/PvdO family nonheme iron enzyme [Planctomycetota bacterium]